MTSKKSVLITGCSEGGIGYSLACAFQLRGLTVFATARSFSKMSSLRELADVILLELDVTSSADIAAAAEAVKAQIPGGKLDYLVNNSGRQYHRPTLDVDVEEGKRLFDVNFWGTLAMIQAFTPLLFRAQGTIVNIGSIVGYLHTPFSSEFERPTIQLCWNLSLSFLYLFCFLSLRA
jgi:1-acylglycerone phosphate reductase